MSKLDIIILDCINKALVGKQDKLGDYIEPTKNEIKALMLELVGEDLEGGTDDYYFIQNELREELRKKVSEL